MPRKKIKYWEYLCDRQWLDCWGKKIYEYAIEAELEGWVRTWWGEVACPSCEAKRKKVANKIETKIRIE